jgi:triacylglycerol lipase
MTSPPAWRWFPAFGGASPRRRLMLTAASLFVAAVVAAAGVRLAAASIGADDDRPPPPQDAPGPVLLVPGYGGDDAALASLAERIRRTGRDARVVRPPDDGTGDLRQQSAALDRAARAALEGGARSVDVVGYSAGGVVARLWVHEQGGAGKARRIVTLGAPHHGADLAGLGAVAVPDACPTACQQLAPGSRVLADLPSPVPTPPAWLAVWSAQDETVTPPESARLEGAINVRLQSVCTDAQVSHAGLPTSGLVVRIVLDALGAGPLRTPGPGVC